MSLVRQVPRTLDDEHRASLALLDRFERTLVADADAELVALAPALARQLEHEIGRHFDFEERSLFTRMADAGDGDLAALLTDEHETIRAVADELLPLVRARASGTPASADERKALRRLGLELVERMVAHIQKETMGLLPLLDDLLDEDDDRALAFDYSAGG